MGKRRWAQLEEMKGKENVHLVTWEWHVGEPWATARSLNWATGWQVVALAKVDNTEEGQATLEETHRSLSPARWEKAREFLPGSGQFSSLPVPLGSHLTEADLKRPKQEKAAAYSSLPLYGKPIRKSAPALPRLLSLARILQPPSEGSSGSDLIWASRV